MFVDFGHEFFVGALVLWGNSCWCINGGAPLCCLHYLRAFLNSQEGVRSGGYCKQTKKSTYAQICLPAEVIQVARGSSRTGRTAANFQGEVPRHSAPHDPVRNICREGQIDHRAARCSFGHSPFSRHAVQCVCVRSEVQGKLCRER